jgi:hypothetical protein
LGNHAGNHGDYRDFPFLIYFLLMITDPQFGYNRVDNFPWVYSGF